MLRGVSHVPTLDIRRDQDPAFVHELGVAFREHGFVKLVGHDIGPTLTSPAYAALAAFFALPNETKLRYHVPGGGGARGYTAYRVEKAKDAIDPDLKEFFHVGPELSEEHPHAHALPKNLFPAEVPGFEPAMGTLYVALESLGRRVLSAIARHLELPASWFDDKIDHANSILRPIFYPPLPKDGTRGVRSAAHEDINLITLLVASAEPGLQILTRTGSYLEVDTDGTEIVVNIGDMLQRLTNHVLVSTTHRVINPPEPWANRPRTSIPFFLHLNPDFQIETLPSCIDATHPNRYPEPITADAYLQQRLREIGLV